jgi:ATP-dependent protease ClpP protease subunit
MQPKLIRIDGEIGTEPGQVSAQMVREQLPENRTDPIAVKIHTEGGNVWEGFAIHDMFAEYEGPKSCSIESSAFSIGSFIVTAFDDVSISPNGYTMLHNPAITAEGDSEKLGSVSAMMQTLTDTAVTAYAAKSGKTDDEIRQMMKATTFLNAQQTVDMGLANRITGKPVAARPFARMSNMPHGVVTALFGAGSGGDTESKPKDLKMADTPATPSPATLQEIKAAFPKASSDFVVKCLEKSMPMASVATAAVEEMMAENESLKASLAKMEEDMAKMKAEYESGGSEETEEEAEPEAKAEPTAKSGARPVAKSKAPVASARIKWNEAINAALPQCGNSKAKAASMANRLNPGLRQAMLDEANA